VADSGRPSCPSATYGRVFWDLVILVTTAPRDVVAGVVPTVSVDWYICIGVGYCFWRI
jgi:hypothetical protein